jgi:hypothetical protein
MEERGADGEIAIRTELGILHFRRGDTAAE